MFTIPSKPKNSQPETTQPTTTKPEILPTTHNLHRYSALMYAGVAALSLATLLALIGIKPLAYIVLKGKSNTPLVPQITNFAADCFGSYSACYSFPILEDLTDKNLPNEINAQARSTNINPTLLTALSLSLADIATYSAVDINTITQVANTYQTVRTNNAANPIPPIFTNHFGNYRLVNLNRTSYYVLLTLSHLITDKSRFDERVLESPNDNQVNSMSDILFSLER